MNYAKAIPFLVLIGITLLLLQSGQELNRYARLLPNFVLVIATTLLLAQLVMEILPTRRTAESSAEELTVRSNPMWIDLLWFGGAPASILTLGLTIGAGVYVFAYLTWRTRATRSTTFGYVIVTIAMMFLLTHFLFPQYVFHGIVPGFMSL